MYCHMIRVCHMIYNNTWGTWVEFVTRFTIGDTHTRDINETDRGQSVSPDWNIYNYFMIQGQKGQWGRWATTVKRVTRGHLVTGTESLKMLILLYHYTKSLMWGMFSFSEPSYAEEFSKLDRCNKFHTLESYSRVASILIWLRHIIYLLVSIGCDISLVINFNSVTYSCHETQWFQNDLIKSHITDTIYRAG
jgi:hypothetical protein